MAIGNIQSYEYLGFVLVVFPTGKTIVHRDTTDAPIAHDAMTLAAAISWVDAKLAEAV